MGISRFTELLNYVGLNFGRRRYGKLSPGWRLHAYRLGREQQGSKRQQSRHSHVNSTYLKPVVHSGCVERA